MAFGTHAVPVLSVVGPVEPVIGFDFLSFVNRIGDIIPDFSLRVPGQRQGLETAFFKGDEILLQWPSPESVNNLKITRHPLGAFCMHIIFPVFGIKPAGEAIVFKSGIVEIPQYGRSNRRIHRMVMVGAFPGVVFGFMTFNAGMAAGENGLLLWLVCSASVYKKTETDNKTGCQRGRITIF